MKSIYAGQTSLKVKLIARLRIFLHVAFLLVAVFRPTIVSAASETHFLRESTLRTTLYTLSTGETAASVANKYHLSLRALRELNQFRAFAHGFDNLQPGDELDVPLVPGAGKKAIDIPAPSVSSPVVKTLAGIASHAAATQATNNPNNDTLSSRFFGDSRVTNDFSSDTLQPVNAGGPRTTNTNNLDSDTMASMTLGVATSEANKQIQQWLNKVGTARVQLDLDKNNGLKNSQFDMLLPLAERKERLFFTQYSLHRTDDRTQSNLGFGYRKFHNDWMLGGNAFLDYDLSRGHMRAGVGAEYWRDYMKLGANGYLRLSNWKDSPDLADHEERPVNGWDVRAQAWLPAHPQLGGELAYEQYYGRQVALFGKEHRQSNPHAITMAFDYTPFPLLSLSVAQRIGTAGNNDTRVGIQLRYQPGEPWHKQINPAEVQQMRSLVANRHALVERNNNILLDYRKEEVIRLQTSPLITGYAGEEKSLGVAVNSKYGLESISWSAAELTAAGGKIVHHGASDFSVILPGYRNGPEGINSYIISGTAVDKKGNISLRSETQVTVGPSAINTSMSTLTPARNLLPADGKTQLQLVLKVNDRQGRPVDLADSEITALKEAKLRGNIRSTLSAFKRTAPGEYVAILTAGTQTESFTVTPFARNIRFASASITLTGASGGGQIANGSLVVLKDRAKADGAEANSVKVTVTDGNGNPLRDQMVGFIADNGATIVSSGKTGSDGSVTVTLTSLKAGVSNVSAMVNGSTQSLAVTFVGNNATARLASGSLTVVKGQAKANGSDANSVKATVTDANGNILVGQTVNFTADSGATIVASGVTGNDGTVTVPLTSLRAAQSTITAMVNGSRVSQVVTFFADSDTARIVRGSLVVIHNNATANNLDTNSLKATVKDVQGNPVSGLMVSFSADNSAVIIGSGTTDTLGEVTVRLTSPKAGESKVTAAINGSNENQTLTFVADSTTAQMLNGALEVVRDNARANGRDANSVKVTITDELGNVVPGQAVKFTADNGATIAASGTTDMQGEAIVTLTGIRAGRSIVHATINGRRQSRTLTFIADSATEQIVSSALLAVNNSEVANGGDIRRVNTPIIHKHRNTPGTLAARLTTGNGITRAATSRRQRQDIETASAGVDSRVIALATVDNNTPVASSVGHTAPLLAKNRPIVQAIPGSGDMSGKKIVRNKRETYSHLSAPIAQSAANSILTLSFNLDASINPGREKQAASLNGDVHSRINLALEESTAFNTSHDAVLTSISISETLQEANARAPPVRAVPASLALPYIDPSGPGYTSWFQRTQVL